MNSAPIIVIILLFPESESKVTSVIKDDSYKNSSNAFLDLSIDFLWNREINGCKSNK